MTKRKVFWTPRKIGWSVVAGVCALAVILTSRSLVETVDADEIMIRQDAIDGDLHVFTTAGMKWQGFGKITKYEKSDTLWFSIENKPCDKNSRSIKTRFNDGANGWVCGSLRYELPRDEKTLVELHRVFGNREALEAQLIDPVIQKSVYMSGPLMSSKESYAERRTDLIQFIKDQTENGVYQTTRVTRRVAVNELGITGETVVDTEDGKAPTVRYKTIEVAVIDKDKNGNPLRQEVSPLARFGVKVYNFSITGIRYDQTVEKQIEKQQFETMEVQTAIAQAKKEEQRFRTEAAKGRASSEKARWEQEELKATATTLAQQEKEVAVTHAERRKDVASLDRDAAKLTKEKLILLGQGEAQRKKLVMTADGALTQKLDAWVKVNGLYAEQLGKQRWVPNVVMGGGGKNNSSAQGILDLFMAKTANDLQLDMSMNK